MRDFRFFSGAMEAAAFHQPDATEDFLVAAEEEAMEINHLRFDYHHNHVIYLMEMMSFHLQLIFQTY